MPKYLGDLSYFEQRTYEEPLLNVGDIVYHTGNGVGKITAYNAMEHGLYNKFRYPYHIQFENGYADVYGEQEICKI